MPELDQPQAIILAGPNGAAKTTVSPRFLGPEVEFINADLIGAELRSDNPNIAGADFTAGRKSVSAPHGLGIGTEKFLF